MSARVGNRGLFPLFLFSARENSKNKIRLLGKYPDNQRAQSETWEAKEEQSKLVPVSKKEIFS